MNELLGASRVVEVLVMSAGLPDLRNNLAAAPGASALNEEAAALLVLDRVEKPDIRLATVVTPSVLADGLLIDPIPSKEVSWNSHVAPNA